MKNIPSLNLELWNKCFAKIFQKHPTLNYGRHPIQFWIKAQEKRERFNFLPWNSSTLNSSFRWNSPGTWVGQKNPIIIRATGALFQHPKSGLGMTNWCYWSECLPNGGVSWLLWKPWIFSTGQCAWYSTGAPPRSSKQPAKLTLTHIHHCFVCCCPGGRQANMEQVSARWRRPVAYGVIALDMLHQAMPHVLLLPQRPPHDHQNGARQRHSCLPPSIFCMTLL